MKGIVEIINDFNARIVAHQATGKLLAGWTFTAGPEDYAQGADSWPAAACWLPESNETQDRKSATTRLTLNYSIAVARTVSATTLEAAKQAFLNALDINPVTMKLDPVLSEFDVTSERVGVTANTFAVHLKITLKHEIKQERGNRT